MSEHAVTESVIAAVQRGDSDAIETFVRGTAAVVAEAVCRHGVEPSQLQPLVANVFKRAIETLEHLPSLGRADIEAFVVKMADATATAAASDGASADPTELRVDELVAAVCQARRTNRPSPGSSHRRWRLVAVVAVAAIAAIAVAGIRAANRELPQPTTTRWLGEDGVVTVRGGPPLRVALLPEVIEVRQLAGRAVYRIGARRKLSVMLDRVSLVATSSCFSVEFVDANPVVTVFTGAVVLAGIAGEPVITPGLAARFADGNRRYTAATSAAAAPIECRVQLD